MTRMIHTHRNRLHPAALTTVTFVGILLLLVGCGVDESSSGVDTSSAVPAGSSTESEPDTANADHPDVLAAALERDDNGSWRLEVTLSSQYDSPERYADGWRVLDKDGAVLGDHTLTHDHANEQPVTRTQSGLEIPDGVDVVTVQGRDTENGYGGATLVLPVPR